MCEGHRVITASSAPASQASGGAVSNRLTDLADQTIGLVLLVDTFAATNEAPSPYLNFGDGVLLSDMRWAAAGSAAPAARAAARSVTRIIVTTRITSAITARTGDR